MVQAMSILLAISVGASIWGVVDFVTPYIIAKIKKAKERKANDRK